MNENTDIIIIGGGLAGLVSAIHLSRAGQRVTVIEKHPYPRHKVCGEYLSREVMPYFQSLDADPSILEPAIISRFMMTTACGESAETVLPLGGLGISRYTLDNFLKEKAVKNGCRILHDNVIGVSFEKGRFHVEMARHSALSAGIVLGAYGKRTALEPGHPTKSTTWLAVKGHYSGDLPPDLVALHTFQGGYCGVSHVEKNKLNICYLVHYKSFREYKNIDDHREAVLFRNPFLKEIFGRCKPLFHKPLSISQVSFQSKKKVQDHMLMTGDAAGLMHPLCGNGMAVAILSAKAASESILQFKAGKFNSRPQFEQYYTQLWNKWFKKRMRAGKFLSTIVENALLCRWAVKTQRLFPQLLPFMIRQTHGNII